MRLSRFPQVVALALAGTMALTSVAGAPVASGQEAELPAPFQFVVQEPSPEAEPTPPADDANEPEAVLEEGTAEEDSGSLPESEEVDTEETVIEVAPAPAEEPPAFNPAEPFQPAGLYWEPNCGLTSIRFYLRDGAGNFVNGVRVRVETRDGSWGVYSFPTGNPGYGPGETDVTLAQDQLAGVWHVWVVDAENRRISPIVPVETDRNDCRPEGHGHQVGHLQFIDRRVEEPASAAQWDWLAGGVLWEPNCSVTQFKLFARGATGQPLNRVRFKVESGNWSAISNPTGIDENRPGWTDIALRPEPFKNTWRVYVIDDRGQRASEILQVETNDIDCHPEGGGHQVATIVWSKRT